MKRVLSDVQATAHTGAPPRIELDELVRSAHPGREGGEPPPLRFLTELGRLVGAVNEEAGLTRAGARTLRTRLRAALAQQVRLAAMTRDTPEAFAAPVLAPVFISGLPGSGAALLQNLLVEHPEVDSPTLWELLAPATPAEDTAGRRALIDRARAHMATYGPEPAHRHTGRLRDATRPGECHRLLSNAFQSPVLGMHLRIPRYTRWLETRDLTAAYTFHHEQLQAITSRIPVASLVLRDPFHAAHLDALLRVYPDARIIRVHRDPATVVPVTAGLSTGLRRPLSSGVDREEVGREWAAYVERHLTRAAHACRALPPWQLLDVRHADLVADPAGVVDRVLRFMDVGSTPAVLRNVEGLAGSAANATRDTGRYRAADYGLTVGGLRDKFSAYRARYGL